jgi:hypothetical protein
LPFASLVLLPCSEGAGGFPISPASFAPGFSDVGGASTDGSSGTSGMDVEATFAERALYPGAGVAVGVGMGYVIGKGAESPIGARIAADGQRIPLFYGEAKVGCITSFQEQGRRYHEDKLV